MRHRLKMSNTIGATTTAQPTPGIVPGVGLHMLEAGSGPAVVFLHGLAAFKEIWWGTIMAIAPEFRAVALDWPGHGGSPLHTAYDLDTLAALAAQSCEALGITNATVIGHSMGGNVAARLALSRPDLVARLGLIDAALNKQHLNIPKFRDAPLLTERYFRLMGRLLHPVAVWGRRVPHAHRGGALQPLARRMHYAAHIPPQVLERYTLALWQASLGERLRDIQQPTLILTGERDPLVRPRQAHEAAALLPHAQLTIMRGALHNPMDDRPAAFHAAMLAWLRHVHAPTTA